MRKKQRMSSIREWYCHSEFSVVHSKKFSHPYRGMPNFSRVATAIVGAAIVLLFSLTPVYAHDYHRPRHHRNFPAHREYRHPGFNIYIAPPPVPLFHYFRPPPCTERLYFEQGQWLWDGYQYVWQPGHWTRYCN